MRQAKVERPPCTERRMTPATTARRARFALAVVDPESRRRSGDGERYVALDWRAIAVVSTFLMAATRRTALGRGLPVVGRNGRRPSRWRKAGEMQRLDRVDVAEARHHALVEQRHLQRHPSSRAGSRQRCGVELGRERFRPEPRRASRAVDMDSRVSRSITPKRRGSVKVTTDPDDISNTTWS